MTAKKKWQRNPLHAHYELWEKAFLAALSGTASLDSAADAKYTVAKAARIADAAVSEVEGDHGQEE